MQKIVLKYGAIAFAIIFAMWMVTLVTYDGAMDMTVGTIVGFATMFLALSMVYVGIRNHRMNSDDKKISFGTGFAIGCLISIAATIAWIGGWEILQAATGMDFMAQYMDAEISGLAANGATAAEIAAKETELLELAESYKSIPQRLAMTTMEILPIGILVSAIAALIEWKRSK